MKKLIAITICSILVLSMLIAGCGSTATTTAATTKAAGTTTASAATSAAATTKAAGTTSKEIGVVFPDLNNPVFVVMKNAIEAKAKELGYTATILNSEGSSETELQNVQNLVSKKVAAILMLSNDANTSVNSAKVANKANIPVVAFNRPINNAAGEAKFVTQVITDNVKGGETAGKLAVELLKDVKEPKIAILRGTLGVASDKERYEGFKKAIQGTPLEKAIVAEQSGNYNTQEGFTTMQNILQANPKLDLVYSENDTMAIGAMSALEGAKMTGVKIIGFDGSAECIGYIVEGRITATMAQKFKTMGSTAVEWAVKAIEGKADGAPAIQLIDTELVTSENAKGFVAK